MGETRTDVKVTADVQDLGRVQNSVSGATSAIGALSRAMQGDLVGAAQQGVIGIRNMWKAIAGMPAMVGPLSVMAVAGVAALKAWENATDRVLERTQRLTESFKQAQSAFQRSMGWTPEQRQQKEIDTAAAAGPAALKALLDDSVRRRDDLKAQLGALGTREIIRQEPVYNERGWKIGSRDVRDTEAEAKRDATRSELMTKAAEATEMADRVGEADSKSVDDARKAADEKNRLEAEAAAEEARIYRDAIAKRSAAEKQLQEFGLSPRELQRRRWQESADVTRAAQAGGVAPAEFQRLMAKAAELDLEAKQYGAAADRADKQAADEKARAASLLADPAVKPERPSFSEAEYIDQRSNAISSRAAALRAQARRGRVMAGSGTGGNLVAQISAQSADAARASELAGKSPEQRSLDTIARGVEETNRILVRKLGLP